MKVLDERNSHKVPEIIEISSFITTGKWTIDGKNIFFGGFNNE